MWRHRTAVIATLTLGLVSVTASATDVSGAAVKATYQSAAKPGSDSSKFAGTYQLVTIEQQDDKGQWTPTARSDSLGYIIYSPTGHMAVQIMPKNRKKYAAAEPTPDEARAAIQGYTAYFGTYSVNDTDKFVVHHREGQINPGGEVDARRFYDFVGNHLILTPAAAGDPSKRGTNHLVWERQPDVPLTGVAREFVGFRRLVYTERTVEKAPSTGAGGSAAQPLTERDTTRTGYIVYTSTGNMAVQIARSGRKKYAGATPTPEEAKAALQSYAAYFGRFTVNEAGKFVVHHQDGMLNPGQVGADAKRFFELAGNRLTLQPPPAAANGETVTNRLVWEMISTPRSTSTR